MATAPISRLLFFVFLISFIPPARSMGLITYSRDLGNSVCNFTAMEEAKEKEIRTLKHTLKLEHSRTPSLTLNVTEQWNEKLFADPKNRLAMAAFGNSKSLDRVLMSHDAISSASNVFNVKIPIEGSPVTNQAGSGRCWIFAATNVLRIGFMKNYNLSSSEGFQLSQGSRSPLSFRSSRLLIE